MLPSWVLLVDRTDTDGLDSQGSSADCGGPKPVSSIIDEAAPKESVDNWPLAIIIKRHSGIYSCSGSRPSGRETATRDLHLRRPCQSLISLLVNSSAEVALGNSVVAIGWREW
jgi:hypothetical protein